MVENRESSEFYPTPEKLVEKMLDGIDWDYVKTILEPSAGKGDILRMIANACTDCSGKIITHGSDCRIYDKTLIFLDNISVTAHNTS